ncbi:restriction endonuclease [Parageobacillus thermoglucosidasius]|uniref:Restriction endonuclease n=1 Tax=Parageobacillus thermoglucosidasius TaxID=1426 RepID=A0AB38QZE2_PARTM|nr:restriction endonuclease [Parageobacillus thermoglucosidasius]UOE75842.1 restriction endonuclease [Parageobacillus thermoglucosidasius]
MRKYDFSVLSPDEFELLCKDLLEVERNITLENFKTGKDGGIDLRYTTSKNENIVIQCKRYSDFNKLKNTLKKEVDKVRKLNPEKYIIMTSVDLSPQNKEDILKLFEGYIKSTSDIIGGDELNSLLQKHEKLEMKHYKLWLSSTNILQKIVNNNILNRSQFTEQQIKDRVKVYVQNESFIKAQEILNKNGFIILSGNPGVGKTTLAEMLSYSYIARGYDFFEISDDIEEAEKVFEIGKEQIFYYDDFLGRNFLEKDLSKNEDKRILQFINKVMSYKNKKLIMTTREYILRQAQIKYELLNDKQIDISKYIINVENYSKFIKAKILYNHLFFSSVPEEYIRKIVEGKHYKKIINHPNYNPRIISLMTNNLILSDISADSYPDEFLKKLDYPDAIWQHAFENQIEEYSQYILYSLTVCGEKVLLSTLEKNFNEINKKQNNKFTHGAFRKAIKELEKTFISINKDLFGQYYVSFQNPSIKDFLIKYISNNDSIIEFLWETTLLIKPLLNAFTLDNENHERKIKINPLIMQRLAKIVSNRFNEFLDCDSEDSKLDSLRRATEFFTIENYPELKKLLVDTIKKIEKPYLLVNRTDYLYLLRKFYNILKSSIDYEAILFDIINNTQYYDELDSILYIKDAFPEIFKIIQDKLDIPSIVEDILEHTINEAKYDKDYWDESQLQEALDLCSEISEILNIDVYHFSSKLEDLITELEEYYNREPDIDDFILDDERYYGYQEDKEIESLFNTLLEPEDN